MCDLLPGTKSTTRIILNKSGNKIEWLCEKLTCMLKSDLSANKTPVQDEENLALSYKLCLLLQDMDVETRAPYDPLVGPLFEFCCEKIKTAASCSNFPDKINISESIDTIMVRILFKIEI